MRRARSRPRRRDRRARSGRCGDGRTGNAHRGRIADRTGEFISPPLHENPIVPSMVAEDNGVERRRFDSARCAGYARHERSFTITLPTRNTLMPTILHASHLPGLELLHRGKVRDVYALPNDRLLIVATDRLSAFDVVLPDPIPGKGETLTQISNFWFAQTAHLVPNHLIGVPVA